MAKPFQRNFRVRLLNQIMITLIRLNMAPKGTHILSVQGRKSGRLYSTPVSLIEEKDQRWLVSPYGEVSWVQNARAAEYVTFTRGRKTERVSIVEVQSKESAPILKKYLARYSITQPYFGVSPDATLDAFIAEAPRHPVFRLQNIE
ncbi:MAG: nitroreductase family deazaflavin-dependent oxidoreductase [Chloroflexota bacterium]